jgi:hypothetical protein
METVNDNVRSKFIFRDASTAEELRLYARQWCQKRYSRYSIGMFGFHGAPGEIHMLRDKVTLDELGELLRGRCHGRVIHFDSCKVLSIPKRSIERFRSETGARAVTGFSKSVDWLECAAFSLSLLQSLVDYTSTPAALRSLKSSQSETCRRLGFRAVWEGGSIGIPGAT